MRRGCAMVLMMLLTLLVSNAGAALYPSKTVQLITGGAPGTVMDVVARQLAEKLAPLLGQRVIVESKPSAGGIVALETLVHSAPDGHTLALVHMGQMSVAPGLFERLPYDTVNDFAHVGIVFRGPQVLVIHPSVPAGSLSELIALARSRRMRYGSPGNGTPTHIFMEEFKRAAGIEVEHVPYKGPASQVAVISGEVDMLLEGAAPLAPHIALGKLRALAVSGLRRLTLLPDVPTFSEQGVNGIETVWVGVVAPRGTPDAIVYHINRALAQVVQLPDIRASFEEAGRYFTLGSPGAMRETIIEEIPRWRTIIERSGIKPD